MLLPRLPVPSRWFVAGVVLLAAFIACGLFARTPGGAAFPRDFMRIARLAFALSDIAYIIPNLLALAMIWVGFARPQWSDRLLWSAAMVLTSAELSSLAGFAFGSGRVTLFPFDRYLNAALVCGFLAYGSLLTVVAPSVAQGRRIPLGVAAGAGLVAIVALAPLTESIRAIDFAGSLLFASACFAFGVAFAEHLGIDLFRREAGEEA